jgi:hypothetical protein
MEEAMRLPVWAILLFAVPMMAAGANQEPVILSGLTVYGMDNEEALPVIADSLHRYITIQFDVAARHPPELRIRFLHCSRDWVPDESAFIQSDLYNTSFILSFRPSPGGVKEYAYRYVNQFPDSEGVVRFMHSGNWIFMILDMTETVVFGEGRFFVVENLVKSSARVRNAFQTNLVSPLNQVHRVDVHVTLPDEMEGIFYTTVDVYQNRRFFTPWRIDAWDRDPYTTVEGFGSGERTFSILNIPPGNEYRTMDFGNANRYPNGDTVRTVEGLDLPRAFWRTGSDHDGRSRLSRFTGIHSDYLPVMFRLKIPDFDPNTQGGTKVFLAGPFNGWNPGRDDMLLFDAREGALTTVKLLRRGLYDYQYLTGSWDEETGRVACQDWLALEGNDWRTTNTYSAFVYCRDSRFGGFDRLAAYAVVRSSGEAGVSN